MNMPDRHRRQAATLNARLVAGALLIASLSAGVAAASDVWL